MTKWVLPDNTVFSDSSKLVSRVEVVDKNGRSYSNWNVKNVELQLQDDGKTLKVFITE